MIQRLYAIRDQLTGYKIPFVMVNDAVAERAFSNVVNDSQTDIYVNPKYYDLYFIGEFDDDKGLLYPSDPTLICTGLSVSRKERSEDNVSDKVRKDSGKK